MGFLKGLGRFWLAGLLLAIGVLVGVIAGAATHSARTGLIVGDVIALVGWVFMAYNLVVLGRMHRVLAVLLLFFMSIYTGVLFGILVGALGHSVSRGIVVGCLMVLAALLIFTFTVVVVIRRGIHEIEPQAAATPDMVMHYDHLRDEPDVAEPQADESQPASPTTAAEPDATDGDHDRNRRTDDLSTVPTPFRRRPDTGERRRKTDRRRTDQP